MNHKTFKSWIDDTGKFGQDSEKYKYDEIMQDFRARGHSMTKSEFQKFYLDPFRIKFPYSEYLIELMTLTGFKEDPVATNEDRRGYGQHSGGRRRRRTLRHRGSKKHRKSHRRSRSHRKSHRRHH